MRARPLTLVIVLLLLTGTMAVAPPSVAEEGDRWGPDGWENKYIVVAPTDWEEILEPLLDWRAKTMVKEIVFLHLEDAIIEGQGRDNAAKLKDRISDEVPRQSLGGSDIVLLLVGDADVIPVRRVFTDILQDGNLSDPLNFRWTDDYYVVGTETDWDRDGDGIYGEDGEVLEEIAGAHSPFGNDRWQIGRIPASTELELERYIDKLLAYERSPPPGDWYTSALLASGLMDVPNYLDNPYTPDIDGGYELFSDNSYESHSKLMDIIPDYYDTTWLYDYPYLKGGDWNRSVDTLDHDSMVSAFDQGHSIVAMNGHGWIDGTGMAHYNGSGSTNYWWDWHNAYDYADADNASNDGMLPWVYVAACYVGDITLKDDKTLERLVMNPTGGAVGMVAGNGENYKGESIANASYGNWFLERHFWSNYFEDGPGWALYKAKQAYLQLVSSDAIPHPPLYDAYYTADYLSHNLLGDPLTRVWTHRPGRIVDLHHKDWPSGDGIRVEASQIVGIHPWNGQLLTTGLPNVTIHVEWDGGSAKGRTDENGEVYLDVPPDSGELRVTASAKGYRPIEETWERDIEKPFVGLYSLHWKNKEGEVNQEPKIGENVTLIAVINTRGRIDYNLARVRFLVKEDEGEYETLLPDKFATIETGSRVYVESEWTPPSAGTWLIKAWLDPEDELPTYVTTNKEIETTILVRGPPVWVNPPVTFHIDCTQTPGGSLDLLRYLDDPDTPLEELEITAEPVEGIDGIDFSLMDGRLTVCTQLPEASEMFHITAHDGIYSSSFDLQVNLSRDMVPRLRISGTTNYAIDMGDNVTEELTIEGLSPGSIDGLLIVTLDEDTNLKLSGDGLFTYYASVPGTHTYRLAIQRADGTTEEAWQGALLVFNVDIGSGYSPEPYGWKVAEVVEGEVARLHLQALDLEGGTVTYSLVETDGLDATLDPVTGVLTLEPTEADLGEHTLLVRLSDGINEDDYTFNVKVTAAPESSSWVWVIVVVMVVAAVAVALYLYWRQRQVEPAS